MADASYAQANTYFAPQGVPGYYGPSSDQSHAASSPLPPYNPADYQQPPTLPERSPQGAATDYYGGEIPGPSQISSLPEKSQLTSQEGEGEGERGLGSVVNKVAGMMGVETSEEDGTMKTLLHMGKKAYKTYKDAKSGYTSYENGQTAADAVEYMQGDGGSGGDYGAGDYSGGDYGASLGGWGGDAGGGGGGDAGGV
ncbi:hypothetical protein FE257_000429 [Aspergillus nanangensis]|uniref:Uncharacterized protein n=1 Tax=Aspergillus nanangensis TaxID=2582783 RepID=A0AAD4GXL3_ASPNN|nr:hypothetical protein FE257_000429 [Aspergillus nanangensis]